MVAVVLLLFELVKCMPVAVIVIPKYRNDLEMMQAVYTDVANMIQLFFLGARCKRIYILGNITQRVNGTNYLLRTYQEHRDRITVKEIDIYTSGRTFRDRFGEILDKVRSGVFTSVVFYFSGHGFPGGMLLKDGCLCMMTTLWYHTVMRMCGLMRIPTLFIFDCCFSGSAGVSSWVYSHPYFASSQWYQFSSLDAVGSVFTNAFIPAIMGMRGDHSIVLLRDSVRYLRRNVRLRHQHPVFVFRGPNAQWSDFNKMASTGLAHRQLTSDHSEHHHHVFDSKIPVLSRGGKVMASDWIRIMLRKWPVELQKSDERPIEEILKDKRHADSRIRGYQQFLMRLDLSGVKGSNTTSV